MSTEHATPAVDVVLALYAALRDSQIGDALALVDSQVICRPLVRPGLSVYYRLDGITALIHDMHRAHGRYQFRIDSVTEEDGPTITVQAVIIPEPGRNQPALPVTSVYTLQNGLITSIESQPGPSTP
jgi:hypothetical protein